MGSPVAEPQTPKRTTRSNSAQQNMLLTPDATQDAVHGPSTPAPAARRDYQYPTPEPTQERPTPGSRKRALESPCPSPTPAAYLPAVEVVFTTDFDVANEALSRLNGPVLGFGVKWGQRGTWDTALMNDFKGLVGRVGLILMCDDDLIVMIHLPSWCGSLPSKLIEILQDEEICKCGVQVRGAARKLQYDYNGLFTSCIVNLLELSNVAREVDPKNTSPGNRLFCLEDLVKAYLVKDLDENETKEFEEWTATLFSEKQDFAANQVYASQRVFRRLKDLADERNINLELEACSNSIEHDGQHYRGHPEAPGVILRNDDATRADGGFLPLLGNKRYGPGNLSKHATESLRLFLIGHDIDTVASEHGGKPPGTIYPPNGVKRTTVGQHLVHVASSWPGFYNQQERKRLLQQCRCPWVARQPVYAKALHNVESKVMAEEEQEEEDDDDQEDGASEGDDRECTQVENGEPAAKRARIAEEEAQPGTLVSIKEEEAGYYLGHREPVRRPLRASNRTLTRPVNLNPTIQQYHYKVLDQFRHSGMTIDEIAVERCNVRNTVQGYIIDCLLQPTIVPGGLGNSLERFKKEMDVDGWKDGAYEQALVNEKERLGR